MVCKMGCGFPKIWGLPRSSKSIGPPINQKYGVGSSPSDAYDIITLCERSDRNLWDKLSEKANSI